MLSIQHPTPKERCNLTPYPPPLLSIATWKRKTNMFLFTPEINGATLGSTTPSSCMQVIHLQSPSQIQRDPENLGGYWASTCMKWRRKKKGKIRQPKQSEHHGATRTWTYYWIHQQGKQFCPLCLSETGIQRKNIPESNSARVNS